jgi:hypothetical protein
MPQEDDDAAKEQEAEEMLGVVFVACFQPSESLQPREESFHFPAPLVPSKLPPVLGRGLLPIALVRCDEFDVSFP